MSLNTCAVIIIAIPANVPMPRYRLFQRVWSEEGSGQVVGLEYVTPTLATQLQHKQIEPGWKYTIELDATVPNQRLHPTVVIWEEAIQLGREGL